MQRYVNRTLPSLWDMRQIAWVLETIRSVKESVLFGQGMGAQEQDCELSRASSD